MKKILVFSDSHGNSKNIQQVLENINKYDKVIFCGDGISDLNWYRNYYINKIEAVKGNCDNFFAPSPTELDISVEGVNIFITHGHLYGVKSNLDKLSNKATLMGSNLVLYGHTHKQAITEKDGITYLNPGSLGEYSKPEYAEIEISEKDFKIYLRNLYQMVDKK